MHTNRIQFQAMSIDDPAPPNVAIVVLNWNDAASTRRAIAALRGVGRSRTRIIVVDNGSSEPIRLPLGEPGDDVTLIASPVNLGYAGGNNLALQRAFSDGADFVWLFNNDALCPGETLARLIAACQADPSIGLVSPVVLDEQEPERVQIACGTFDLAVPTHIPCYDLATARILMATKSNRITLSGAALLIRRSVYEAIGGLDEALFAYWEDTDYSIRAAMAGYRNVLVADAVVYHPAKRVGDGAAIRPHFYYYMARNEILLWRKHARPVAALRAVIWVFRRQLGLLRGTARAEVRQAILAGLWDGVCGAGGAFVAGLRAPGVFRMAIERLAGGR